MAALVQAIQRLTPQIALASTGVLRLLVVAVASPYAVFRAADVIWPPRSQPLFPESLPARAVKRPRQGVAPARVLQGELFPLSAVAG